MQLQKHGTQSERRHTQFPLNCAYSFPYQPSRYIPQLVSKKKATTNYCTSVLQFTGYNPTLSTTTHSNTLTFILSMHTQSLTDCRLLSCSLHTPSENTYTSALCFFTKNKPSPDSEGLLFSHRCEKGIKIPCISEDTDLTAGYAE